MDDGPLSSADILRFMKGVGATSTCTVCGSNSGFSLFPEQQKNARIGTIAFQFPAHEANGAEVIDTIFLSCKKCGAIRLHTRDVVTSWLKAHP